MDKKHRIRVATYNIHKCRGLDGRVQPQRIVEVLREIDADIIALQEVVSIEGGRRQKNQSAFIAEELGLHRALGVNRQHRGGAYGNVLLSRFPVCLTRNYSISVSGREPRGCLRADLDLNGTVILHVFNAHLGTAFLERRRQARILMSQDILNSSELEGPRLILGDFNEWMSGLTSRLLTTNFNKASHRENSVSRRTYPGILPFLDLDHVYHDPSLQLEDFRSHRSRTALIASDHLPLVAEFSVQAAARFGTSSISEPNDAAIGTRSVPSMRTPDSVTREW